MMSRSSRTRKHTPARVLSLLSLLPQEWSEDRLHHSLQIQAAINFSHTGSLQESPDTSQFGSSVKKLLQKVLRSNPQIGFFSWDASEHGGWHPLFAQATLLQGIQSLRKYPKALILIENLAYSIASGKRYWTNYREEEWGQAKAFVENLVASHTPQGAHWQLLLS